mmetsp:Transcript_26285/g.71431  ORF Transcript_26285/g.71431 Transcript_26285/m.71431 type:complete len:241 (-) Transcript_26285:337-1059(-)
MGRGGGLQRGGRARMRLGGGLGSPRPCGDKDAPPPDRALLRLGLRGWLGHQWHGEAEQGRRLLGPPLGILGPKPRLRDGRRAVAHIPLLPGPGVARGAGPATGRGLQHAAEEQASGRPPRRGGRALWCGLGARGRVPGPDLGVAPGRAVLRGGLGLARHARGHGRVGALAAAAEGAAGVPACGLQSRVRGAQGRGRRGPADQRYRQCVETAVAEASDHEGLQRPEVACAATAAEEMCGPE